MGELISMIDKNMESSESLEQLFELDAVKEAGFVHEVYYRYRGGKIMDAVKELKDNANNDLEMALYLWTLSFLSGYHDRIPEESVGRLKEVAESLNRVLQMALPEPCRGELGHCREELSRLLREIDVQW